MINLNILSSKSNLKPQVKPQSPLRRDKGSGQDPVSGDNYSKYILFCPLVYIGIHTNIFWDLTILIIHLILTNYLNILYIFSFAFLFIPRAPCVGLNNIILTDNIGKLLSKYTGWVRFLSNSFIILITGYCLYSFDENGWSYIHTLILTILLIFVIYKIISLNLYEYNIIKFKFFKYYLYFKKNYKNVLLGRFIIFLSMKSTWFVLEGVSRYLEVLFGNEFINFGYMNSILHTTLLMVLFSCSLLQNNMDECILPMEEENLVVNWLSNKLQHSDDFIKSNFNLSNGNIKMLIDYLNINTNNSPPLYAFYFSDIWSYVISERNIKYARPYKSFDQPVHLFKKIGPFLDRSFAINYLTIASNASTSNNVAIFDSSNCLLYVLSEKKELINSNDLLFYLGGTRNSNYYPYDPLNKKAGDHQLYVKSLDGKYHKLDGYKTIAPNLGDDRRWGVEGLFLIMYDFTTGRGRCVQANLSTLHSYINTMIPSNTDRLRDNRFYTK